MNTLSKISDVSRFVAAVALGWAMSGCGTMNPERTRARHAESYRGDLLAETTHVLEHYTNRLSMADCLALGRERSLSLTVSRLEERLARINRQTAFSAFLPQVEYEFQSVNLSKPPEKAISGGVVQMQDQNVRESTLRIVQPVFTPNAWLMYVSARRGADIQKLARQRAEQMLDLQVVNLFYQYTVLADRVESTRRELESAAELQKESSALFREGYLVEADLRKVDTLQASRAQQLSALERQLGLAKSRLLEALNLWPLADVTFDTESLAKAVAEPDTAGRNVEECIYTALTNRLELFAGDRGIELRKNEILRSIALFLPNLYGFANFYTTSDSYTVNDQYWGSGLQGTMSVFAGFRNVNAYRAARANLKQAYVEREEQSMSIMVQVIEAWKNLQDVGGQLDVARQAAEAARLDMASAKASYDAGTESFSSCLQATAASESAEAALRAADNAKAVALYVFNDVMGLNKEARNENK